MCQFQQIKLDKPKEQFAMIEEKKNDRQENIFQKRLSAPAVQLSPKPKLQRMTDDSELVNRGSLIKSWWSVRLKLWSISYRLLQT
ncbi:hypothetical protein ACHWQZ_G014104 [Mnemiopsis leidyi]